jgi:hypothetical protein
MATVVIGGSRSGAGKTTLACALIAALSEFDWTAVKISRHGHRMPEPVFEETAAGQGRDTARYLSAGARRALLVTADDSELPLDELNSACGEDAHVLLESNRIIENLCPDVCLAVVGEGGDIKPSFSPLLHRADAVVARSHAALERIERPTSACAFLLEDLRTVPPEMATWLRGRLMAASAR